MTGSKRFFLAFSLSILTGSVFASAATAGGGNDNRVSFREFRQQNLGMDRHAARVLFRENHPRGNDSARDRIENARVQAVQPVTPNIEITTQLDNRLRSHTRQTNENGNTIRFKNGLDLDLTSNSHNIVLGKNLFADGGSIQITTADGTKTVSAGSRVTAAEYVAVKQVLSGGRQTLTVDHSGRASGGSVELDSITSNNDRLRAANYVNAGNVTTIGDFSRGSDFRLLGDLNNYGTISAQSGSNNTRSGAIHADDINNFRNATISSNLDLTLDASGNLNNAGTITSTGGLVLTAGGAVSNSGTVSAATNVDIGAATINNRGSISSANGNVNLNGLADAVLQVNNGRGTISAINGAINLRDASYNGVANSYITGGDLYSQAYNMHAGQGTAYTRVDDLTGKISQSGSAAHVVASTDLMRIGDVCLTGDPTFFNTAGSVIIDGNLTVAQDLVVVATGNVQTASNMTVQAGNATQGFGITFIAGADFSNEGGANRSGLNNGNKAGATGTVSLTGKSSKTGGSVILGSNSSILAQSTNLGGNSNGGSIQMFAFDGKGADGIAGGMIDTTGVTINSSGSGTGTNGNISLIAAGAKAPDGIPLKIGTLTANGGSGNNADITAMTRTIVVSEKKALVVYDENGVRTNTAFLKADKVNKKSSLQFNGPVNLRGTLSAMAGNDIILNGAITTSADAFFQAGHDIQGTNFGGVVSNGSVVLRAGHDIGTTTEALQLFTSKLDINAGGDLANVIVSNNGALTSTFGWFSAGDLTVSAAFRAIDTTGTSIVGDNVVIGGAAVTLGDVTASDSLTVISGPILNSSFQGTVTTPKLSFSSANSPGVGTSVERFVVPVGVKELSFDIQGSGSAYIQSNSTKTLLISNTGVAETLDIAAKGSLDLDGSNDIRANAIAITTDNGTLSANSVIASGTTLGLTNTSAKGKIVFDKNATVVTTGANADNLLISVGPNTADPMPQPIKNVDIKGSTLLTGGAIKAKAPLNTIDGVTKTVTINNGLKAGAITLGGNVFIGANQPN